LNVDGSRRMKMMWGEVEDDGDEKASSNLIGEVRGRNFEF
jgi:hypothetical protein